jgi:CheY-like chemotaxis protein
VAGNGIDALRRAKEAEFDLIVLDIMLPGKDAHEVCRNLRWSGRRMRVLMLTAKAQEAEKGNGFGNWAPTITSLNRSARMTCGSGSISRNGAGRFERRDGDLSRHSGRW